MVIDGNKIQRKNQTDNGTRNEKLDNEKKNMKNRYLIKFSTSNYAEHQVTVYAKYYGVK